MRPRYKKPEPKEPESIETTWTHRLPHETPSAFAKFLEYRDQGARRSFTAVAKSSKVSISAVAQMALKNRWRDRALAFDWFNQEQTRLGLAALRREARQRQIKLSMAMQQIGSAGLAEMLDKLRAGIPLHLSASEITNLAKAGQELEQAALGEGHDDHVIPKISVVFPDGRTFGTEPEAEDEPPRKPN